MKTTPLPEILKQITPLPWLPTVNRPREDADKIDRIKSEAGRNVAFIPDHEHPFQMEQSNAAYLAHAANVLPGLVEVLRELASMAQQHDPETGFTRPVDPYAAANLIRPALYLAVNVPVNS